jgi:hypothetical protein
MSTDFQFDAFLSHSSKDKAVVRPLAERLRADGLKVWFDEWVLKPGDSIPAKIEDGLEHSRVLVLCMSAQAFGSDWAQLEASTCGRRNLRFRDPLNQERRFIPLRLDDVGCVEGATEIVHELDAEGKRRRTSRLTGIPRSGNVNENIGKFDGADLFRTTANELQSLLYAD